MITSVSRGALVSTYAPEWKTGKLEELDHVLAFEPTRPSTLVAMTRNPSQVESGGLLSRDGRHIDSQSLVNQVKKQGFVGVVILDDTHHDLGTHTAQVQMALADALPPRMRPFVTSKVKVKVISVYGKDGQRHLGDAIDQVRRLVDTGQAQVIVSVADFNEDNLVTAKGMSAQLGRPIASIDTATRADLKAVAARQHKSNPDFSHVIGQIDALGVRVPFFVAAGNEGVGDALSLATTTINVGATNLLGQREMTGGWFDLYRSGLVPTGAIGVAASRGEGFSSFAAPRAAAELVKSLGNAAGL